MEFAGAGKRVAGGFVRLRNIGGEISDIAVEPQQRHVIGLGEQDLLLLAAKEHGLRRVAGGALDGRGAGADQAAVPPYWNDPGFFIGQPPGDPGVVAAPMMDAVEPDGGIAQVFTHRRNLTQRRFADNCGPPCPASRVIMAFFRGLWFC